MFEVLPQSSLNHEAERAAQHTPHILKSTGMHHHFGYADPEVFLVELRENHNRLLSSLAGREEGVSQYHGPSESRKTVRTSGAIASACFFSPSSLEHNAKVARRPSLAAVSLAATEAYLPCAPDA